MAIYRENPYGNARFKVMVDGVELKGVMEVRLPEMSLDVKEFRSGTDKDAAARALPGQPHYGSLVLTRGFDGSLELMDWWKEAADGSRPAKRHIAVTLMSEDNSAVVAAWEIAGVFPVSFAFSSLVANGCEVLTETIAFSCDSVRVE